MRRMRLLHGLGQHVAARHLERAPLEARIGLHHHHVGDLLGAFQRHRALFLRRDVEAAELQPRRALADAELRPPVGDEIEHGDRFRRARGMIVVGDHLADAVAEPDALGARRRRRQEHLGGRAVRILLEEVVLHRPGVVDAQPVGEFHLVERVLHQLPLVVGRPRAWAAAARRRSRISSPALRLARLPSHKVRRAQVLGKPLLSSRLLLSRPRTSVREPGPGQRTMRSACGSWIPDISLVANFRDDTYRSESTRSIMAGAEPR